ncbi:prefoldin subunit 5 [Eurytemora carolleeae]|uniref:prefoldin subunit 5 n=1 Tax=Eurytemora carolleeae TaxID=1294199 RepID=UPI000C78DA9E|nr:prefoldin subunit 5 [Eurytemora carolleeae]|eukprot:XP_023331606.1 prefoldin subunit 5-like [Eurytemora affinis]
MAATKAQSSLSPQSGMQAVDLTKLNLMQLTQFKNGLDTDIQFYQESIQNLKHAQTKFQESGESMARMSPDAEGKDILVPLTGSMYVPGTLVQPEKVIVDVGTGYYVEKDITAAKDYFQRKVKFVTENMERVQMIGSEKAKIRDLVMDVMQEKLQSQFSQMAPAKASS